MPSSRIAAAALAALVAGAAPIAVAQQEEIVAIDNTMVRQWNRFFERLVRVHEHFETTRSLRKEVRSGGYHRRPDFYREVANFDRESGRLLSRVQYEKQKPNQIHAIELFFYRDDGSLERDYSARFLPDHRNAPIQTLVNLHGPDPDLDSFRQFDASGEWIYEQCSGEWLGRPVDISHEFPEDGASPSLLESEEYIACFARVPFVAGRRLDPTVGIPALRKNKKAEQRRLDPEDRLRERIALLTDRIEQAPEDAQAYVVRGQAYFEALEFDQAVADFTKALTLDDRLDQAYFGRGLALGRQGRIDEGIADLSVYIERNPESSLAYTKRGVRHIWKRDFERAEADLARAIELDPNNAEAHDDMGVVLAQREEYDAAANHFETTIRLEKTYQKAYHNLALVRHRQGRNEEALGIVEKALRLDGRRQTRSSLQLKANILLALGRTAEAAAVAREAELTGDLNWSELLATE